MFDIFRTNKKLNHELQILRNENNYQNNVILSQTDQLYELSGQFVALQLALKELYDDDTLSAIMNRAMQIDGNEYLNRLHNSAAPFTIQLSIDFFR